MPLAAETELDDGQRKVLVEALRLGAGGERRNPRGCLGGCAQRSRLLGQEASDCDHPSDKPSIASPIRCSFRFLCCAAMGCSARVSRLPPNPLRERL